MALFNQSNEESLRQKIRDGFDDSVKDALRETGLNDPLFGGLIVESAIGSFYQSMKDEPILKLISDKLGLDYDSLLEEELKRALNKYLE